MNDLDEIQMHYKGIGEKCSSIQRMSIVYIILELI